MLEINSRKYKANMKACDFNKFLVNDFTHYVKKQVRNYFLKEQVAHDIVSTIKIYQNNIIKEIKKIIKNDDITLAYNKNFTSKLNSKDLKLLNIEFKKFKFLIQDESTSYFEIIHKMNSFYKLQEYSIIEDIKYISTHPHFLLYIYNNKIYFDLIIDEEEKYNNYLLKNNCEDFSFFGYYEDDYLKRNIYPLNIEELKYREEIWKNIYSEKNQFETNNPLITIKFNLNIFDNLFLGNYNERKLIKNFEIVKKGVCY